MISKPKFINVSSESGIKPCKLSEDLCDENGWAQRDKIEGLLRCEVNEETRFGYRKIAETIGKTRKSAPSNFESMATNFPRFGFIKMWGKLPITQQNSLDAAYELHMEDLYRIRLENARNNFSNLKTCDVSSPTGY